MRKGFWKESDNYLTMLIPYFIISIWWNDIASNLNHVTDKKCSSLKCVFFVFIGGLNLSSQMTQEAPGSWFGTYFLTELGMIHIHFLSMVSYIKKLSMDYFSKGLVSSSIHTRFLRCSTARGSCTSLVTEGPTKV